MKKLRIACIGGWHVLADKFSRILSEYPECAVVAVWDTDEARGRALARARQCRFEPSFEALAADPAIDAMVFTCEIARHDLIVDAALAGKHILVEKPLALKKELAWRIRDAVKKTGVHFGMSDPILFPPLQYAKRLIAAGTIGEVTNAHLRMVNYRAIDGLQKPVYPPYDVENAGCGIMADLGGHTLHVAQYFFGRPQRVSSAWTSLTPEGKAAGAEENVTTLFAYENGLIVVGETSWVSPDNQMSFAFYGTKGMIEANYKKVRYRLHEGEWTDVPEEALPQVGVYPLWLWVRNILENVPNDAFGRDEVTCRLVNLDDAVELAELTDAVGRSNTAGAAL